MAAAEIDSRSPGLAHDGKLIEKLLFAKFAILLSLRGAIQNIANVISLYDIVDISHVRGGEKALDVRAPCTCDSGVGIPAPLPLMILPAEHNRDARQCADASKLDAIRVANRLGDYDIGAPDQRGKTVDDTLVIAIQQAPRAIQA